MFASTFNPSFFASQPAGRPSSFDPNALLQGLAQSDLPSLVNDILLNLAAGATPQAPAQDESAIPPSATSSSSTSAKTAPAETPRSSSNVRRPRLDLSTTASSPNVTAVLDLPGFAKSDVSIAVRPGKLVISAERRSLSSIKGKERATDEPEPALVQWTVRERQTEVKWVRELPLAVGVKPSEIKASMADGVLTVTYPKLATVVDADERVLIE